jgi:hypothetical protein
VAPSLLSASSQDQRPMKRNDLSRALVAFDQDSTIVAVVELSLNTWLVSGLVPGVMRRPLKKQPADPDRLIALLHRWRDEAVSSRRSDCSAAPLTEPYFRTTHTALWINMSERQHELP